MPARVDKDWKERVKSYKAENTSWGAGRITRELEKEAARLGLMDVPSERWVGKYLREIKDEDLREYRLFRWPQSMQRGDLPWEASAAALELLDVRQKVDPFERTMEQMSKRFGVEPQVPEPPADGWESWGLRWGRPSIRLVRWYWRVTQAAPDLPAVSAVPELLPYIDMPGRYDIAVALAEWEAHTNAPQRIPDSVETYLSFAPWRSPERASEYKINVEGGQIPGLTLKDLYAYESARTRAGEPLTPEELEDLNRDFFRDEDTSDSSETQDQ